MKMGVWASELGVVIGKIALRFARYRPVLGQGISA